jgi:hypothetical protein
MRVLPYRADRASVEGVVGMFESLHRHLQQDWWRRLLTGQPSLALEVHCRCAPRGRARAWLELVCPCDAERLIEASLRGAYPNCVLERSERPRPQVPAAVLRLRKQAEFTRRAKLLDRFELERRPPMDRLITAMAACGEDSLVQLALTPAPILMQAYAKHAYRRREAHLSRARREHLFMRDRSMVDIAELRGGLELQHRPLFLLDIRIAAATHKTCARVGSQLRAEGAENRLVERRAALRGGARSACRSRVARALASPWPTSLRAVFASTELAALWHMPSVEYSTVPFLRGQLPVAPAPPAILRPLDGCGALRDALGPVCIHPELRSRNTAVIGAAGQGKSSYLLATVAEDLRREHCAVIVLDPKGDLAERAIGVLPPERPRRLLDLTRPTCGFNPLAVDTPAETIADHVAAALSALPGDPDTSAAGERHLRNAVIAVLACDPSASLWDVARLLSVGEQGYTYRARVSAHLRELSQRGELAELFTAGLVAQLADSRSSATAKLDAPFGRLARLLGSAPVRRVLLGDLPDIDLERVIAAGEVLVVKGAPGAVNPADTAALMRLLLGMLDAVLARRGLVNPSASVAVALKLDEAQLVLDRHLIETLSQRHAAGLEIVASWRTAAEWVERDVRSRLDALFAHRVRFAGASSGEARDGASLMMSAFADVVRPDVAGLSTAGRPDAGLNLPSHHAIVSWVTPCGRQPPFLARVAPLHQAVERPAADPGALGAPRARRVVPIRSVRQPPSQETP